MLTGLIPRTILALLAGEVPLPTGSRARDFVFVRDAARACVKIAEAVGQTGHGLDCTFRSGWEFSDTQVIKSLASVISGTPPVAAASERSNPLEWRPENSFAEALSETIEWYRRCHDSFVTQSSSPMSRAA